MGAGPALLTARNALLCERDAIDAQLTAVANADPVCCRLMTAPGIGVRTALLFRHAIDEPNRFARSRAVGPHFGLTAKVTETDFQWETSARPT